MLSLCHRHHPAVTGLSRWPFSCADLCLYAIHIEFIVQAPLPKRKKKVFTNYSWGSLLIASTTDAAPRTTRSRTPAWKNTARYSRTTTRVLRIWTTSSVGSPLSALSICQTQVADAVVVQGEEEEWWLLEVEQPCPDEVVSSSRVLVVDLAHPDEGTVGLQITRYTMWMGMKDLLRWGFRLIYPMYGCSPW